MPASSGGRGHSSESATARRISATRKGPGAHAFEQAGFRLSASPSVDREQCGCSMRIVSLADENPDIPFAFDNPRHATQPAVFRPLPTSRPKRRADFVQVHLISVKAIAEGPIAQRDSTVFVKHFG
jgi:hypothetical protein